jgi:hypothetical protein
MKNKESRPLGWGGFLLMQKKPGFSCERNQWPPKITGSQHHWLVERQQPGF